MDTCQLCGLPFHAARSVLPKIAAATAASAVACTNKCTPGQTILRMGLAGLVTYMGTELLSAATTKVCRCQPSTE